MPRKIRELLADLKAVGYEEIYDLLAGANPSVSLTPSEQRNTHFRNHAKLFSVAQSPWFSAADIIG